MTGASRASSRRVPDVVSFARVKNRSLGHKPWPNARDVDLGWSSDDIPYCVSCERCHNPNSFSGLRGVLRALCCRRESA